MGCVSTSLFYLFGALNCSDSASHAYHDCPAALRCPTLQVTIEEQDCFTECAIGPNVGLEFDGMCCSVNPKRRLVASEKVVSKADLLNVCIAVPTDMVINGVATKADVAKILEERVRAEHCIIFAIWHRSVLAARGCWHKYWLKDSKSTTNQVK
eukprot:6844378-Pyramimonas_sp.AAC.1